MDMENLKREISVLKLKTIIHKIFGLAQQQYHIAEEVTSKSQNKSITII